MNISPDYDDVQASHGLTDAEKAELDDQAAEIAAEATPALTPTPDDEATRVAAEAEAAAAAAVPDATPDPAPVAAPVAPPPARLLDVPAAPSDFATARTELKAKYEAGDLTLDEYLDQRDGYTRAEAEYIAQRTYAEQTNAQRQAEAAAADPTTFENLQAAWVRDNTDFMGNAYRAKVMQDTILAIDQATGGTLSPADLIARAQKDAFEVCRYEPPAPAAPAPTSANRQDALRKRQPDLSNVPRSLGGAPAAGVEAGSKYVDLDAGSVLDMERAVAGMSDAEVTRFLEEADSAY